MKQAIETTYPVTFRRKESEALGQYIKQNKSVVLIGMKRVGINNFLRFFLNHDNDSLHVFVKVDLNDLIERNISAFWTLLLTRLVDSVQGSGMPESDKRTCRKLFVQSIQLKDHFFTLDSVRKVVEILVHTGLYPTLFLIRFDRLQDSVTPEFFSNIIGLCEAVNKKLTYVFTSHRPLPDLAPEVFKKQYLSVLSRDMFLSPAGDDDMNIILNTLLEQHHSSIDTTTKQSLLMLSGGYVQYLQLALIRLAEEKKIPKKIEQLQELLSRDEQVTFQSEELFESLTKKEKDVVLQIKAGYRIGTQQREDVAYLWNTGMVRDNKGVTDFFSPLFADYVGTLSMTSTNGKEFTKKEHLLFTFLKAHEGELCEREAIIEAVWPEHQDLGVSDWAIDRLVARLRSKLKAHGSSYSVTTVVTRGYKLVKS